PHQPARRGEQQPSAGKQDANARRREPDGAKQAHLARALLDREPEEQRRQQECGGYEEEAEISEVLAEVGRAARRREPFGAYVAHRQPQGERIDRLAKARCIAIPPGVRAAWRSRRRREPHRRAVAVARTP